MKENESTPEPMIKFRLDLEFYIPVLNDYTFLSAWPDFATFKYRFIETKKEIPGYPLLKATTILMEYFPQMNWQNDLLSPKPALINCIIFLNNFIDAYRLANDLAYIRNFTISDLPPFLILSIGDAKIVYTLPNLNTLYEPMELTKEMVTLALQNMTTWRLHQPFEIIDKFRSKAFHHFYNEEYVFAIVELQTSFESYIRMCHSLILQRRGLSDTEIEKKMSLPLKNTIEQHLSKGLNENLKIDQNLYLKKWNNTLYRLRNQIVHAGLSYIHEGEATEALDSYQEAINYLSDVMVREKLLAKDKMIKIESFNKKSPDPEQSQKIMEDLMNRGITTFLDD